MNTPVSEHDHFALDWLALREGADHRSRAVLPETRATAWLERRALAHSDRALRIVDLGSGTASNARYLAPRLPGPQHWRLIDHDATLLAQARARGAGLTDRTGRPVALEPRIESLVPESLAEQVGDADLVTASALFDLVSAAWIEALAEACAAAGAAVLFTLSVDGCIEFVPEDGDDDFLLDQLAAHQTRDKGLGTALGHRAPGVLEHAFTAGGYCVECAPADWRLTGARDAALARALVDGWAAAAREQAPRAQARIEAWAQRRIAQIQAANASIVVGHVDLFAAPAR